MRRARSIFTLLLEHLPRDADLRRYDTAGVRRAVAALNVQPFRPASRVRRGVFRVASTRMLGFLLAQCFLGLPEA